MQGGARGSSCNQTINFPATLTQLQRALLHEVQQPPGRGHDDVRLQGRKGRGSKMVRRKEESKGGTFMKPPVLTLPCSQQAACSLSSPGLAIPPTCLLSASSCCPLSAPPVMHTERRPLYLRRSRHVVATCGEWM